MSSGCTFEYMRLPPGARPQSTRGSVHFPNGKRISATAASRLLPSSELANMRFAACEGKEGFVFRRGVVVTAWVKVLASWLEKM